MGTLTLTGGLTFNATSTYTVDIGAGAANADKLVITGTPALLGNMAFNQLSAPDQGIYNLLTTTGTRTGTFAGSTPSGYTLVYGTSTVDLQHKADQASFTCTTPASPVNAFVSTNLSLSATLTNTAPAGSANLVVGLSSTGSLSVGSFTPSDGSTIAPGVGQAVTGTINTGVTAGAGQGWQVTNTDSNAVTTTANASGAVNVFLHGVPTKDPTSTLAFGNFHVGDTPTAQNVTISNNTFGTPVANTGAITWTAGSLAGDLTTGGSNSTGDIASGGGSSYGYNISTTSVGSKSGSQAFNFADTTSIVGNGTLGSLTVNATATVWRLASASAHTPEPVNLGNVHVGDTFASQLLSLPNSAANDGFSEKLNAGIGGATGDATAAGLFGGLLAAGSTNNTDLSVSLTNTATAGAKSGTASITLTSDGTGTSGLANSSLTSQTVNISGTVYSGNAIWANAGSASWGATGASATSGNWTADGNTLAGNFSNAALPGVDGAFSLDDTAILGSSLGSGTVSLNGAAPAINTLTFNGGTTGTLATGSGGSLTLRNNSSSVNPSITVSGNSQATISAGVVLANNATVNTVSSSDALNISGQLTGASLIKAGSGTLTLTLTGNNTYSGGTTVNNGTLLVNNTSSSGTGAGAVNVSASATLGGNGSIAGAVSVTGVLSPGGAGIETLSSGTLTFNDGSTFAFGLNSSVLPAVGAALQKVVGALSLSLSLLDPSKLTLTDIAAAGTAFSSGTVFSLINYTGAWNGGLFTYVSTLLTNGAEFKAGLNKWKIDYNAPDGGSNFASEYAGGADSFVNLTALSAYQYWIDSFISIPVASRHPADDPDGDGANNLSEFAFGGWPDNPASRGLFFTEIKDNGDADIDKELTFTCAVRRSSTATFASNVNNAKESTIDGVTYVIEACATLDGPWNAQVSYIGKSDDPPSGSGLPSLADTDWEYCTFSAFNGLPNKGFLRAGVTMP